MHCSAAAAAAALRDGTTKRGSLQYVREAEREEHEEAPHSQLPQQAASSSTKILCLLRSSLKAAVSLSPSLQPPPTSYLPAEPCTREKAGWRRCDGERCSIAARTHAQVHPLLRSLPSCLWAPC